MPSTAATLAELQLISLQRQGQLIMVWLFVLFGNDFVTEA